MNENKMIKGFLAVSKLNLVESGSNQYKGDCIFCNKLEKFYVNKTTGLWDCKVCGKSGNYLQFLEAICKKNQATPELKSLSKNRGLPISALDSWEIGFDGENYTFPIRNKDGKLQDLRRYLLGGKILASPNCQIGLWNVQGLVKAPLNWPVYICEGEWDGMAMAWLVKKLNKEAVVVAVPGANTFKSEWAYFFQGRKVICCYDNDIAGETGQLILKNKLTGIASMLSYINWPIGLPQGYDLRDLISEFGVHKNKPNLTWKKIEILRGSNTTQGLGGEKNNSIKQAVTKIKPITFEETCSTMRKWLFMESMDGFAMAVAFVISNKLIGDPLWGFLVAPPGGAKTEIISTFSKCPEAYFTSSLTPHALISGAEFKGGGDPSLIPQLNGKVLFIKDFTTIMGKQDKDKDEIFGILRDAYDGSCSKVFGTGQKRHYESKFSILAAVTPKIYELASTHQALGERFLKFCIGENLEHFSEEAVIERAINNIQSEALMRNEMAEKMAQFIAWKHEQIANGVLPKIPREIQIKLIQLAKYGARMRGTVSRDRYRHDEILASPSAEIGSRIGKQLAKLLICLAMVFDHDKVTEVEYNLIKKCMLDTIAQKTERAVREIFREARFSDLAVSTKRVSELTRFPQTTCGRILSDLNLLKIIDRKGKGNKYEWGLSTYIKDTIKISDLYNTEDEINRQSFSSLNTKGIYKKKLVTK